MVYKLTLDAGLMRAPVLLPAVNVLKAWESEGKIEIFEADRAKEATNTLNPGWPGAAKPPTRSAWPGARAKAQKKNDSGAASFQRISAVLFPHRDSHRLSITEVNAVAHLQRHVTNARSVFVTSNTRDFIDDGRRERLNTVFKIVVMTPEETVTMFQKTHSWDGLDDGSTKKKRAKTSQA